MKNKERPFTFEIYGKVFERLKSLENPSCMYTLSAQSIREIIKFTIEECEGVLK